MNKEKFLEIVNANFSEKEEQDGRKMTDEEKISACELVINSLNARSKEEYPQILQEAFVHLKEDGSRYLQATFRIEGVRKRKEERDGFSSNQKMGEKETRKKN